MHARKLRLVEPVPIPDTLCTGGLVLIQDLGFGARFVCAEQSTCYEDQTDVLAVAAKVVMPYEHVWPGVHMASTFMAKRAVTVPGSRLLRLVK